jgi:hypothetical protein
VRGLSGRYPYSIESSGAALRRPSKALFPDSLSYIQDDHSDDIKSTDFKYRVKTFSLYGFYGVEMSYGSSSMARWGARKLPVVIERRKRWRHPTRAGFRGTEPLIGGAAAKALRGIKRRCVCMAECGSMPRIPPQPGGCNGGAQRGPLPSWYVLHAQLAAHGNSLLAQDSRCSFRLGHGRQSLRERRGCS